MKGGQEQRQTLSNVVLLIVAVALLVILAGVARDAFGQVPEAAHQHKRAAMAAWVDQFGMHAPTATLAAQIHKESSWRADAASPFAFGLAQFTPATAGDVARWNRQLRPADPGNPAWALRAQGFYMARLLRKFQSTDQPWLMALAGYNSGPGWVDRARAVCRDQWCCDDGRWVGHVQLTPDPKHADWAVAENRNYVKRIITVLGPRYERAGWGPAVANPWP
jgi:soluble lytic murein transglycosylase-like protein